MKIALIGSHGGHLSELIQLLPAFDGFNYFIITYHSPRDEEIKKLSHSYFMENIGTNPFLLVRAFFWAFKILLTEKPQVLVSTGSEIAIPFFILGKLLRKKTIFIEGYFRVNDLSKTGRIVYGFADIFLVQWPELLKECGKKARYEGAVI
jgi:beta-1,4-N-acetylglucosaminyltransferase